MAGRDPSYDPDLERGIPRNELSEKRAATTTTIAERETSFSQGRTDSRQSIQKPQSRELAKKAAKEWTKVTEKLTKNYNKDLPDSAHPKNDNLFKKIHRSPGPVRYAAYMSPLWILLAIPVAITCTIFRNVPIPASPPRFLIITPPDDRLHLAGLFIWLEFATLGLWVAKSLSWLSIQSFGHGCDAMRKRPSFRGSDLLLERLAEVVDNLMDLPVTLILWSIMSFASTPALAWFDKGVIPDGTWAATLRRVLLAAIVVSAIIWVERFLICLSFVSYYSKRYDQKNEELQTDTVQIKKLLWGLKDDKKSSSLHREGGRRPGHRSRKASREGVTEAWTIKGREYKFANQIFDWAMDTEEHAALMGEYFGYSMGLTEDDSKLTKAELKGHLLQADEDDTIDPLNNILNGDYDDDITFIELRTAVKRLGRRKEMLRKTLKNVSEAMEALDRPLSCLVIVAIAFIYAAFFVNNFSVYAAAIFTAFTGLGFAISGTVTEFLGSCIFLFVKQPYAVGDKCDIKGVQLEVDKISLMSTKFIRIDNKRLVQLSHNILNTLWIENLSRSKRLREHFTVLASPDTPYDIIKELRDDIAGFIENNRRDFCKDSVNIQLASISDLTKLELEIEIEHKFKYYDEELHLDRSTRFKWALLSFLKHRGVLAPGVEEVVLGEPSRPTYNLTPSSDLLQKSKAAQIKAKEEQQRKNLEAALRYREARDDEPTILLGETMIRKQTRSGHSSAIDLQS